MVALVAAVACLFAVSASSAESPASSNPYASLTNEQLADVADRWDALNRDERRWFFAEVRRRLVADDGPKGIPIRSDVRFGQVVRTRVVGARSETVVRAAETRQGTRAYGFGFERRRGVRGVPTIPDVRTEPLPAAVRLPASSRPNTPVPDGGR